MSNAESISIPSPRLLWAWIIVLWAAIFAIAVSGYPNLVDNERRVGGYVMDVVQNGHWAIQQDVTGDIASKPPMLTWIASIATLCFVRINRFALYLPSALGTLAVTCLLFSVGRKHFGWRAGFIGALAYLLSYVADKQVVTARYDGVFAFPVALAAMAAYRAWTTGKGWTPFWLACALATLVKGPLGVVLAGSGLLAAILEKRSGNCVPLRGSHWLGIFLYLGICGGWFALAYMQLGHGVINKMLVRELGRHAVADGEHRMGQGFWEPVWNTFTNFFPWSIVAGVGLWRVFRRPAANIEDRRFERFLFCWVIVSMILFSIASHQRGRLAWPLVPALALFVGRELDRWLKDTPSRKWMRAAAALSVFVLAFFITYHHWLQKYSKSVQTTLGMKQIAAEIRARVGEEFPITYVDAPYAVQFYLNTLRRNAKFPAAAELLRGDAPAFALVVNYDRLVESVGTNVVLHELLRGPSNKGEPPVRLVSNREKLEPLDTVAACIGPTRLRLEHARLEHARANEFIVSSLGRDAAVTLQNVSSNAITVGVRWAEKPAELISRKLAAAETWRATNP